MTETDKENILAKIQKLLALSSSPNQSEAEVAMSKAQEMMVRYKLTMAEVAKANVITSKEEGYARETVETGKQRLHSYHDYIMNILQNFFFVKVVESSRFNYQTYKKEKIYYFLGKPTDIAIAKHTYQFLKNAFRSSWENYRKNTGCHRSYSHSYYRGMFDGISEKLRVERKKVEQEMGLIVVPDAGLKLFVENEFPDLRQRQGRGHAHYGNAMEAGRKAGRSLQFNKPIIGGSSSNTRRLLT